VTRRRLAIAAAFTLIAAATLIPAPGSGWQHEFWCFRCGESYDPLELLLNIALFVPLGLALRAARVRAWLAVTIIVATTVTIEILQYFVIVGRDGVVRDCVSNAIGGVVGLAVQPHLRALWPGPGSPSRRLAWCAALLWIAHAAMAALLFRPSAASKRYYSQVAPELGQFDQFAGTVLSASIDGERVEGSLFDPALEARVRAADSITLASVVIPGPPKSRVAPIVNVVDSMGNEVAILAQQRTALVFQARTKGQDLGFYAPAVVMDDVFETEPSTTPLPLLVAGVRRGSSLRLRVAAGTSTAREARLTLSPALGWTLWWPHEYPGRAALVWVTAAWVFVCIALLGFWSEGLAAPLVAALGAEVLVPLALGPGVSSPTLVVSIMGALAGLAISRLRSAVGNETLGASDSPDLA
jgi:hypothetical protein